MGFVAARCQATHPPLFTQERVAASARQFLDGTRFLDDGRLELDTNPVENAIRPICLTRKNALFAGHGVGTENCALLASIDPS